MNRIIHDWKTLYHCIQTASKPRFLLKKLQLNNSSLLKCHPGHSVQVEANTLALVCCYRSPLCVRVCTASASHPFWRRPRTKPLPWSSSHWRCCPWRSGASGKMAGSLGGKSFRSRSTKPEPCTKSGRDTMKRSIGACQCPAAAGMVIN